MANRSFPPLRPEPKVESGPPSRTTSLRQRLSSIYARFHSLFLIVAGAFIALSSLVLYDSTKPPPQYLTQSDIDAAVERTLASATPKPSYESQVYEIIRPSVVSVRGVGVKSGGKTERSHGAGTVIDDRGTILTSLHIVQNAVEVYVVFADGTESEASIIVRQPENDLAVLRPDLIPDDLMPATLGISGSLRVGDEIVAVGNPFGISSSLTAGVVSGLGRSVKSPKTGNTLTNLIQFDAAVNPGNSGGPLVSRNGDVVGIVTSLLNPTDQDFFIGIGFAVPIEAAAAAAGPPEY